MDLFGREAPEIARLQYYTPRIGGWWEWWTREEREGAWSCADRGRSGEGHGGAPVVKPTLRDV